MKEKHLNVTFVSQILQKKSNLKSHIESVNGGKQSKCDICLFNFTQKGSLKIHIQSIHEGKNI